MTPDQMRTRLAELQEEWKKYEYLVKARFPTDAEWKAFQQANREQLERARQLKEELIRLRWSLLSEDEKQKARDINRMMRDDSEGPKP
ncbi:hypothetical protein EPD60_05565 [Flaviaesturariibacter flavus]|uniref:Uncharacterized protein n=1 Tax=Flaviaesturariibacter flavus TaxID=2502780 RepID=A0A4R1BK31_9BACT|nr:hypothetical protein [Flaviaesturariibacter flavus]TCJ17656.1 hypothetical protein EPD60_05565 [Flaviaesturariibacter flavus]